MWWALPWAVAGPIDPRIVRTDPPRNGIAMLWPRIVPGVEDASVRTLAARLRDHLRARVEEAVPRADVLSLPEPQRTCPRDGCPSVSIGVLLGHSNGGCVAVGLVSGPGQAEVELFALAGDVTLEAPSIPFRKPPEDFVVVRDMVPCTDLIGAIQTSGWLQAIRRRTAR